MEYGMYLKIHITEECHRKLVDSGGHVTSLRGQIDIQVGRDIIDYDSNQLPSQSYQ